MAENDIYTTTPGSAVADTLQQILASRRLEARQNMLDQLKVSDTQSEMDYRKQQAEGLREQREAMAEYRRAQAAAQGEKALKNIPIGPVNDATATKIKGIAPELLQQTGGMTLPSTQFSGAMDAPGSPSATPAQVSQSASVPDASVPSQSNYLGTEDQRDEKQRDQLLQTLLDNPSTSSQMKEWLKIRAALPKGEAPPAPAMWNNEQEAPLTIFDEANGQLSPAMMGGKPIMGKKGERPIVRTRPPEGKTETFTLERGENGQPVLFGNFGHFKDPITHQPITDPKTLQNLTRPGAPPRQPGSSAAQIKMSEGDKKNLTGARMALAKNPNDKAALAAIHSAASTALLTVNVPVGVKMGVREMLKHPNMTFEQMVPLLNGTDSETGEPKPSTPQEIETMRELYEALASPSAQVK